jgi:putative acetyltransferase
LYQNLYPDDKKARLKMKNNFRLRRALIEDIAAIVELYQGTVRNINNRDYAPQQIDVWARGAERTERWVKAIEEQYFIIAEINGCLAGFSSIAPDGYLDFMYVHKDFQRLGTASALLAEIEMKAYEQKNPLIYSHVSATAKGFFEKNGYYVKEVVEDHFGGVMFMNNVMEKKIS